MYNVVLICRVIPAIDSGCGVFFLHLFGWRLAIHLGFGGPCGVYPIHKPATYNVPKAAKHVNSKYNKYICIYTYYIYMYIMYTCGVPNCFFGGGLTLTFYFMGEDVHLSWVNFYGFTLAGFPCKKCGLAREFAIFQAHAGWLMIRIYPGSYLTTP